MDGTLENPAASGCRRCKAEQPASGPAGASVNLSGKKTEMEGPRTGAFLCCLRSSGSSFYCVSSLVSVGKSYKKVKENANELC